MFIFIQYPWWRHQMETFSAVLAICAGNSPVTGKFPAQRPVTRSFDVFYGLRFNKRLSWQSWGWWFGTPLCPLWRYCNAYVSQCGCTQLSLEYIIIYANICYRTDPIGSYWKLHKYPLDFWYFLFLYFTHVYETFSHVNYDPGSHVYVIFTKVPLT